MKNKNKKKKKESKKEEETKEEEEEKESAHKEEKDKEEPKEEKSELEEELQEEESPSQSKFSQFVQVRSAPPVLEKTAQEPETATLEQEIGFTPKEKESERKYDETIKYDIESEYQEGIKRQRDITPDMISQVAPVSSIRRESIGRGRIMPGQEVHMRASVEMPTAPASQEEYNIIKAKKSKRFRGETTSFQENLERRYEIK